jgi:hypothetical protein
MLDSLVRVSRRVGRGADRFATDPKRRGGETRQPVPTADAESTAEQSSSGRSTGDQRPRAKQGRRGSSSVRQRACDQAGYTTNPEGLATIPPAF